MARPGRRTERGAATAELAVVLPLLVAVTMGLVWLLAVAVAQIRVVDAARETARAAARGEAADVAVARGLRVAPAGARITVRTSGSELTASAVGQVAGPGGLFSFLGSVTVRADAVAAAEGVG